MAEAIPMLRREQRRHLLMNGWLIAGFIIVGTAVTNERGIFRPIGLDSAMSATAKAFVAIASPLETPRLRDVRSVSSLDPFDVTAPSRDLRRRLIDALNWEAGDEDPNLNREQLAFAIPPLNTEIASNEAGDGAPGQQAFGAPPESLGISTPTLPQAVTPPIDAGVVPEPATWAMLIVGFGILGSMLRIVGGRAAAPIARRRRGQRPASQI